MIHGSSGPYILAGASIVPRVTYRLAAVLLHLGKWALQFDDGSQHGMNILKIYEM